jgi:D-lactate dehydrogenase
MKIALFSSKSYDREYFAKFNGSGNHEITYYEAPLNSDTVNLVQGYDAVCVFVNDKIDRAVLEKLSEQKIRTGGTPVRRV